MAMTRRERKAALMLAGRTMADIARELDVTIQHVSAVVAGRSRSPRVEAAVAQAIGKPASKVFPKVAQAVA